VKIALAQFDPVIGEIENNCRRMAELIRKAAGLGVHLVVFGEMSIVGYPPRDLLRKEGFVSACEKAVESLASEAVEIAALVGFVRPSTGVTGRGLENCAALLAGGRVREVHVKTLLPTYDVFDETRYFAHGNKLTVIEVAGRKLGLSICEDLWDADSLGRDIYGDDPIARLASGGAEIIVNLAASPYEIGKAIRREELFARQARRHKLPIVYVNQVGGNDELIFDGCSSVIGPDGKIIARAKEFAEDLLVVDFDEAAPARCEPLGNETQRLAEALKLGLCDYVTKCGFSSVVLGSSGGIDSAVVAALAAEALGSQNVHTIAMPSRYSSAHSLKDAQQLAENLGLGYEVIPIEPMHRAFEQSCGGLFSADERGQLAAENIQARIRGNIVMAYSNAKGHLPLATGNKSELSVGYCTLYGDMCGGLAPIGDVLKTKVYELASQLNASAAKAWIPQNIIAKAPSAELKPGQTDQDKLPPYELLDEILREYIEHDKTAGEIIDRVAPGQGALVRRIVRLVDLSEYKRQQAARVLKVSGRAFGMGRRVPIAQKFV
jgi:NAD+ synthetase